MWMVPLKCDFFFNDTGTTEIYPLSLHDALPFSARHAGRARKLRGGGALRAVERPRGDDPRTRVGAGDRKSTRLNSSHTVISYAVFCLIKKGKEDLLLINRHALPKDHVLAAQRIF